MYIPTKFQLTDKTELVAFMQRFSFATIITTKNNIPIATQLPFVIKQREDKLILSAHFAIANEQVNFIENNISLVIFSEPHAYISPSHYDKVESVPTWDYIAVHVYGKAKILHTAEEKMHSLEDMIHFYEKDYYSQWKIFQRNMFRACLKVLLPLN
jgi:transcriptional regulator